MPSTGFSDALYTSLRLSLTARFCYIKIAICTVLLAVVSRIPNYADLTERFEPAISKARSLKIEHPFSPIPPDLKDMSLYAGTASHIDKLDYRLTLPILGHLTHTGRWTVIVWCHISSVGVFYLLARLASRAIGDSVGAGLFVLGLAPTYFGTWFFNDVKFGDGVAFFFLLLSIATAYPLVSFFSFIVSQNLYNLPEALITIFNASWALSAVALVSLVLQRKWLTSSVFIGAFTIAVLPAFLVVDFARSARYTFVVLLISVLFLWGDKETSRKILCSILLGNILLNSHHSAAQFGHLLKSILRQNLN